MSDSNKASGRAVNPEVEGRADAALQCAQRLLRDAFPGSGIEIAAVATLAGAMLTASYSAEIAEAQRHVVACQQKIQALVEAEHRALAADRE